MARTLVVAGKIGPAFATYKDDDKARRIRQFLALPDADNARVLVNVDSVMFPRLEWPAPFKALHAHATGVYYIGTETYTPGHRESQNDALRTCLYAGLPPHPSHSKLPLHRTEAGFPNCSTCDGGGCLDCTDPAN